MDNGYQDKAGPPERARAHHVGDAGPAGRDGEAVSIPSRPELTRAAASDVLDGKLFASERSEGRCSRGRVSAGTMGRVEDVAVQQTLEFQLSGRAARARDGARDGWPMKTTVLVPTYRRPRDLERCLSALRRQTEPADEVLVLVREGDDETARFLQDVAAEELRLRCVTVTEPGQVPALNRGLEEARGDIVAILDDDAAPHPDWLPRIRRHFDANPALGGVGGRDYVFRNGELWQGRRRVVGKVQWFGRVLGNHHYGYGAPRDVDYLKGANMSFRRAAIEGLRFDCRLRGPKMSNDLAFCLAVKRRGWRLLYDPAVAVDHFWPQRHDYDRRDPFSVVDVAEEGHNATLVLLEHLPPLRRIAFIAWAAVVGTSALPGPLQFARLVVLSRDPTAWPRMAACLRGRWEGWQTWRRGRRFLSA